MATFFIGNADVAGNEFLDVEFQLTGAFIRPVVLDRVIEHTAELQWFAETPTGGGSFGEGFPHNPRIRARAQFPGATFPQLGVVEGDLDVEFQLTGDFVVDAVVTENELDALAEVTGFSALTVFLRADINAVAVLTGTVRDILLPSLDPEILTDVLGSRPSFPLLIYVDDVTHVGDLREPNGDYRIELYQAFRISTRYVPRQGDFLAATGALPNSLGMRVEGDFNGNGVIEEVILFRRPLENEVVVVVDGTVVEQWNGTAWMGYVTLPQRALNAMRAFEVFDPSGTYDYYAKILGVRFWQLQHDTARLLDFIDPQNCPVEFLPVLGDNFGAPIDSADDEAAQRETIRTWIPLMQLKGLDQAVRIALKNLGFLGYATHIWVSPNSPGATQFQERPLGYSNDFPSGDPSEYYPASQVALHLNELNGDPLLVIDSGTKQRVAKYLKENILPAHVQIRAFTTDVPAGAETVTVDDGEAVFANVIVGGVNAVASAATVSITGSVSPIRGTVTAVATGASASVIGEVIPGP